MSDRLKNMPAFGSNQGITQIKLSFDLDAMIHAWSDLRKQMIRELPDGFTRDEWAYLISFISSESLYKVYESTFGTRVYNKDMAIDQTVIVRDKVALWLPNNVSLLGPLVMILISITGSALRVKAGSRSNSLCELFSQWALSNLTDGPLKTWLAEKLIVMQIAREDPRLVELSQWADVKIAFGSDQGCQAVAELPGKASVLNVSFADKQSRIWCFAEDLKENALQAMIKVFAIYGRAGCTSPQCITIIDGNEDDCNHLAQRLAALWPKIIKKDIEMHSASDNVLSYQLALANQLNATLVERNKAVISVVPANDKLPLGHLHLPISCASLEQAIEKLPENIQTIGYAMAEDKRLEIAQHLQDTHVKRFVPVEHMHHFGPVWDGIAFWRALFREG